VDYYEILGVKESATQDEIKTAYYDLTKKYHPDVTQGDDDGARIFVRVTEAYEVLGNASLRQKYDQGVLDLDSEFRQAHRPAAEPIEHEEFYKSRSTRTSVPLTTRQSAHEFDKWSSELYKKQRTEKLVNEEKFAQKAAREKIVKFENRLEYFLVFTIIGSFFYLAAFDWLKNWIKSSSKPQEKPKTT